MTSVAKRELESAKESYMESAEIALTPSLSRDLESYSDLPSIH